MLRAAAAGNGSGFAHDPVCREGGRDGIGRFAEVVFPGSGRWGGSGGAVEPDVVGAAGGVCDRVLPGAAADELGDRAGGVDRQQCRGVCGGGDRRGDELGGWTAAGGGAREVDRETGWGSDAGGGAGRGATAAAAGGEAVDRDQQWAEADGGVGDGGSDRGVGSHTATEGDGEPEAADEACVSLPDDGAGVRGVCETGGDAGAEGNADSLYFECDGELDQGGGGEGCALLGAAHVPEGAFWRRDQRDLAGRGEGAGGGGTGAGAGIGGEAAPGVSAAERDGGDLDDADGVRAGSGSGGAAGGVREAVAGGDGDRLGDVLPAGEAPPDSAAHLPLRTAPFLDRTGTATSENREGGSKFREKAGRRRLVLRAGLGRDAASQAA